MDININNFKSGVKQSPKDDRDFHISRLVAPVNVFPEEFCLDLTDLKIQNQGNFSCCVAESLAYTRFLTEHKQTNNKKPFSVGWIYGNRKPTDLQESGMYVREALDNLLKDGVPFEEDFPILEEVPTIISKVNEVKDKLKDKAYPYRISAYANVNPSIIDDMKNALMQIGAISIMIPVFPSFFEVGSDGIVKDIGETERFVGFHQLAICGWNKNNKWIGLNSWEDWGENSKFYMPQNYLIWEAWSISDNIIPAPPQPTPVPTPTPVVNKWWRIQVGAYRSLDLCYKQVQVLNNLGYKTYVVNVNGLFKIQLSAFSIESNCRAYSKLLKTKGIDNFIVYY